MSEVVRNIWEIQKIVWEHRKRYLHTSTQHHEEDGMTEAMQWEFAVRQNGLLVEYSCFFTGKFKRLLNNDGIIKSQWLRSVLNAHD